MLRKDIITQRAVSPERIKAQVWTIYFRIQTNLKIVTTTEGHRTLSFATTIIMNDESPIIAILFHV